MPPKDTKTPAKATAKAPVKAAAKAKVVAKAPAKAAASKAKAPAKASAKNGAKGKAAAKAPAQTIKKADKLKKKKQLAEAKKEKSMVERKGRGKGRRGYKGNLKIQSQLKEKKQRFFLRKAAKTMIKKNPKAKSSKAYKDLKKKSITLKVRLNKVPTRAVAARLRTAVLAKAHNWKNGQAPKADRTIKKKKLWSWRENNPLFVARPKNMTIGCSIRPKADLKRFVKWPKYIRIQRQKRILLERLKVPPMINQFRRTARRNHALNLFRLLKRYRPEDSVTRKNRLRKLARVKATGGAIDKYKKPISIVSGINHVAQLVFSKQAKLVLIASDVDPIEVVIWLPTLCRKMDVPYMIVKGRARMGTAVNMKTCSAIAITSVKKEHEKDLSNFVTIARRKFNDNVEARKKWGGLKLGPKSRQRIRKQRAVLARERLIRKRSDAEKKKAKGL